MCVNLTNNEVNDESKLVDLVRNDLEEQRSRECTKDNIGSEQFRGGEVLSIHSEQGHDDKVLENNEHAFTI